MWEFSEVQIVDSLNPKQNKRHKRKRATWVTSILKTTASLNVSSRILLETTNLSDLIISKIINQSRFNFNEFPPRSDWAQRWSSFESIEACRPGHYRSIYQCHFALPRLPPTQYHQRCQIPVQMRKQWGDESNLLNIHREDKDTTGTFWGFIGTNRI